MRGGELLDVHEEGAVAVDVDDLPVWSGHFGAERGGVTVTHGAESGAGEELARIFELVELG